MQEKLRKYCQVVDDLGFPFCLAYINYYGVAICEADSDSKSYMSLEHSMWDELVVPALDKEIESTTHNVKKRCGGAERRISARVLDDLPSNRNRSNRVFASEDVRNLHTLLGQDTLFPVTPIVVREDGTKVLVFPHIFRDPTKAEFRASNRFPQTVSIIVYVSKKRN